MFRVIALVGLLAASAHACSKMMNGGGGCGGGGGCRAKARGVLRLEGDAAIEEDFGEIYGLRLWESKKPENATIQQVTDPNFLFGACCAERNLPAGCQRRCNFAAYNQDLLGKIFVGADECPLESLPEMHFCAAQGRDHSQCCRVKGVNSVAAGDKCLVFCNQIPDKFTKIDYTFASFYEKFDEIKQCFHNGVRERAHKFFLGQ